MDWTYKTFKHEAVFNAPRASVLAAARATVADALSAPEDTPDGFVARGFLWHSAQATCHLTPTPDAAATRVAVELRVERGGGRYYMLVDVGGYYDGQIDKWFNGIAQRLGGGAAPVLVSKTTANVALRRGCWAGCLVYLILGACLASLAIPLDHGLFPQAAGGSFGPITALASVIGLVAGVAAFLVVMRRGARA